MHNPEQTAVLFANEAFYAAFIANHFEAMEKLWAKDPDVSCIHPGMDVVSGREEVLESWNTIMSTTRREIVKARDAFATVYENLAVVTCHEVLSNFDLVATNVFVRENDDWKLIHHQAGPAPPPLISDSRGNAPATLQ
jgi:ketosteroid isomerase-like protein